MGRPRQRRAALKYLGSARPRKRSRVRSTDATVASIEEYDDEIDKFHKGADKIPLNIDEDTELSEDDAEEPVFDLKAQGSCEDEEDEDSDDELDEEQLSGLAAKMAKQAKMLRQKTTLMEDNEEFEAEEQAGNEEKVAWGKRKRTYYDADNADYELLSSDEEAPAEEEAEARRLQHEMAERLRPEDFDLDMDDDDKSAEEDERTLQEVVAKAEAKAYQENKGTLSERGRLGASIKDTSIFVEEVKKDVSALSKEEQMNVVMSDAPELVGLLAELRECSSELHNKIEPLLVKVKKLGNANKDGLRFIETKHMLILSYIQSILFYLLMKAEGHSVRDHPVIARLVDIRTLLQKLQPIDEKLQSQIDELLAKDTMSFTEVTVHEGLKSSTQLPSTPPREENCQAPDTTLLDVKEPKNGPMEVHLEMPSITEMLDAGTHISTHVSQQKRTLAIVESDEDDALPDKKSLHRIIATKIQKRKPMVSGDMDLPLKEDLAVRRAKLERHKCLRIDNSDSSDKEAFEDELYQEAKRQKIAKQAAKENDSMKIVMPETTVDEDFGKRHITYQMEKNKGLTPHRKKLTKNPRKKYKLKHQKAVIRRKGQVREVKRPTAPYGGEATGIRTTISRSVRFHS